MNVTLLVNPAARSGAHTGAAPQAAELLRAHIEHVGISLIAIYRGALAVA